MAEVLSLVLPFFGLIALGFAAGRIWQADESGLAWLNIYIIYFALPAMFYQLISRTPVEDLTNWRFILLTTTATFCALFITFWIGLFLSKGSLAEATVKGLVGGYSNVGYMGPGLSLSVFGVAAAAPAALIFCFDIILVFVLTPLMMVIAGAEGAGLFRTLLSIVRKVFLHPFILATMAGFVGAVTKPELPVMVMKMLDWLSATAAPCALFAIGVTVALRPLKKVPVELPFLVIGKLIIHPVIVILLFSVMEGFDPVWRKTAVLMASLPPAATIYVLARQYNSYVERASSAILVGTVASVPTVTVVVYLLVHDLV